MDNTDKMVDRRMLRTGRKWCWGRERENRVARQEREGERAGVRERDMGHSDIRQMAPSAQLCLHYSHCSSKNRPETREEPAILVYEWVFAGGRLLSAYVYRQSTEYMCVYLHMLIVCISACVCESLYYAHCICLGSWSKRNCLLFSRGRGLAGLHST